MSLFDELKRRNVIRVATGYVVAAWLLIQVLDTVFRGPWMSEDTYQVIVILLAIGFVPAVVGAWVFQLTPDGLKLDKDSGAATTPAATSRKIDRAIIATLAIAVSYFAIDKFVIGAGPAIDASDMSIAVLPFDYGAVNEDDRYFIDGVTNEIRNLLTRIDGMHVIASNSTMQFRGSTDPLPDIANTLGVAHLLLGSVRRFGDTVQVTAQLFDAKGDRQLWGDSYERQLRDLFRIQDEIASEVVSNLHIELVGEPPESEYVHPEVLELVAEATQLAGIRAPGTGDRIAALVDRALQIDPEYTPALNLKVMANWFLAGGPDYTFEDMLRDADRIYDRILEIDPDSPYPDFWYGFHLSGANRLEEAAQRYLQGLEKAFRRPEHLVPDDLRIVGYFALHTGKLDTANRIFRYALDYDPMCIQCRRRYADSLMYAGSYEEAQWQYERYLNHSNEGWHDYVFTLLLQGKADEAIEFLDENVNLESADAGGEWNKLYGRALRAMALYTLGRVGEAQEVRSQLVDPDFHDQRALTLMRTQVAAWMDDEDFAFEKLHEMAASGFQFLHRQTFSPVWQNLHDDPRWLEYRGFNGTSAERLDAIEFDPVLPTLPE